MGNLTKTQKIQTLRSVRGPLIVWMIMIGFVAIYVLTSSVVAIALQTKGINWSKLSSQRPPANHAMMSLLVTVIIFCIICAIWFSPRIFAWHRRLVIGLPVLLLLAYIIMMPASAPVITIGTYPVFTIEAIICYEHPNRILAWLTAIYLMMWVAYSWIVGWLMALVTMEAFVFVMAIVFYYWRFYQRQVAERRRVEALYDELQLAYQQVEASAIRTERQRVARELHDTLTQGLAGVVMQLEAASSFLDQGKPQRAKEIIDTSVDSARTALQESRTTLTDLRSTTEESLPARLQLTTEAIRKNYRITTTIQLSEIPDYSPSQLTEITRIVTEALTNVAKHAETDQALITSQLHHDIFKLKIIDFGTGFDITAKPKKGHFGLQGLQERAKQLNGVITVLSSPGEGTTVTLTLPTERKELA